MILLIYTSCRCPLDYVLGPTTSEGKPRETPPQILSGDPDLLRRLRVPGDTRKGRFFSATLSWSEDARSVPEDVVRDVVADLRSVLLAGFEPCTLAEPVACLHTRERGFDVHLIYAQVHLRTGRPVSLYCHRRDRDLFAAWRETMNRRYGWTSPEAAPYRWLEDRPAATVRDRKLWWEIDAAVKSLIRNGSVTSRDGIVAAFESFRAQVVQRFASGFWVELPGGEIVKFEGEKYSDSCNLALVEERARTAHVFWRTLPRRAQDPSLESLIKDRETWSRDNYGDQPVELESLTKGERIRRTRARKRQPGSAPAPGAPIPRPVPIFLDETNQQSIRLHAELAGVLVEIVRGDADPFCGEVDAVRAAAGRLAAEHRRIADDAAELEGVLRARCGPERSKPGAARGDGCRETAGDQQGGEPQRGDDGVGARGVLPVADELQAESRTVRAGARGGECAQGDAGRSADAGRQSPADGDRSAEAPVHSRGPIAGVGGLSDEQALARAARLVEEIKALDTGAQDREAEDASPGLDR